MTTWRKEITTELHAQKDDWTAIESCTLSESDLDVEFDNGYGGPEGPPFTLWTKTRVYFPVVYDGSEWVASVPRNPNGEKTPHVGG